MALEYKLAVPNGVYQKDGQQKTAWLNIGAVMSKKDGGLVMKLDAIPTNIVYKDGNPAPFNGWVNMFPADSQSRPVQQVASDKQADFDPDIPF